MPHFRLEQQREDDKLNLKIEQLIFLKVSQLIEVREKLDLIFFFPALCLSPLISYFCPFTVFKSNYLQTFNILFSSNDGILR